MMRHAGSDVLACRSNIVAQSEDKTRPMPSTDELDRSIGDRIKTARLRRQMTLAALAAELGLTYQQIHKYETGRNRISASTLFKVADCLGVDLTFFFSKDAGSCDGKPAGTVPNSLGDEELRVALSRVEDGEVREKLTELVNVLADAAAFRRHR